MLWLLGIWFAEYAEVDYHLKRGSKFKAWVSTSTDRYRPPYARSPVYVGRQCVFVGTTNRTDYLHDRTGNRRFLPVAVRNIDLDAVRPIVDALWAEAVALYRAGAKALGFTERKRESRKGSRQYVFRKPARDGREAENVTEFPERAAGPPR